MLTHKGPKMRIDLNKASNGWVLSYNMPTNQHQRRLGQYAEKKMIVAENEETLKKHLESLVKIAVKVAPTTDGYDI